VKIINAFWEERNLGLKVCELIFNADDSVDLSILREEEKLYDYLVAKIPSGSNRIIHDLENEGFRYLENQQVFQFYSNEYLNLNKSWKLRHGNIVCEKVDDEGALKEICDKFENGR
jgi:hypothetical protein